VRDNRPMPEICCAICGWPTRNRLLCAWCRGEMKRKAPPEEQGVLVVFKEEPCIQ